MTAGGAALNARPRPCSGRRVGGLITSLRSSFAVLRFGVWEACRTTGGPGGWPPGLVAPQAKFFGGPTYKYIQMVCRTACRTAHACPLQSRHGALDHLPDRLRFAGPFAGPGVVRWSGKPNRSPGGDSDGLVTILSPESPDWRPKSDMSLHHSISPSRYINYASSERWSSG